MRYFLIAVLLLIISISIWGIISDGRRNSLADDFSALEEFNQLRLGLVEDVEKNRKRSIYSGLFVGVLVEWTSDGDKIGSLAMKRIWKEKEKPGTLKVKIEKVEADKGSVDISLFSLKPDNSLPQQHYLFQRARIRIKADKEIPEIINEPVAGHITYEEWTYGLLKE